MRPEVSILLPAFDAEATLAGCLRSVLRQSEPRFECVLVDDGSRDGTRDCALHFAARDPRIRVIAMSHQGLVTALNMGLAHCRAPLVARMDADDLMHRDRLAAQVAALQADPRLVAVGCHVRLFPRAGLTEGLRAYEHWLNGIDSAERLRAEAFVECPLAHPGLMVRTGVLRGLGYRDAGWPEDYDLILRLLAGGHAVGVVPRRLVAWRDGPRRLWRTDPRYGVERFTSCKAAFLARGFLARTRTYVLWGYGGTGRSLRRALLVHDKRPTHVIEVHPGRIGQTIHGARVISIADLRARPRGPIVASVADEEARREIRAVLDALGFRETHDYICAA